jgi:hypothetical protein
MSEFTEEPNSGKLPDEVEASAGENSAPTDEVVEIGKVDEAPKDEVTQMIEPHAPHESVHTWKDVFIHIGIITVGLLLAIGLEQTVEFFHHRHQVTETRKVLAIERQVNARRFAIETEEFRRILPIIKMNLKIYQYLRQHPGAAEEKWPGKFSWAGLNTGYMDSAWKTAEESTVLQYMPRAEVSLYGSLYTRLDGLSELNGTVSDARGEVMVVNIQEPDARKLSVAQLDEEILLTSKLLLALRKRANSQRNLNRQFPDFAPAPTREELSSITHDVAPAEDQRKVDDEMRRMFEADKGLEEDAPNSAGNGAGK